VLFTKLEYLILNHRCSPLLSGNLQNIDYSSMEFLAAAALSDGRCGASNPMPDLYRMATELGR
jgi:hypothetical protein